MPLKKAIEILTFHERYIRKQKQSDTADALQIALICMSYCDALIKALGEVEIAKLTDEL